MYINDVTKYAGETFENPKNFRLLVCARAMMFSTGKKNTEEKREKKKRSKAKSPSLYVI
jgi:hypothetical protein